MMKRIISSQALLSRRSQIANPFQANSLLLKPMYFRSDKFRKDEKRRALSKESKSQPMESKQQKVPITPPTKLMQSIKNGCINTIPLYLKYFQKNQGRKLFSKERNKHQIVSAETYASKLSKMYKMQHSQRLDLQTIEQNEKQSQKANKALLFFLAGAVLLGYAIVRNWNNEDHISLKSELMTIEEISKVVEKISEIYFWKDQKGNIMKIKFKKLKNENDEGILRRALQSMGFREKGDQIQFISPILCPNLILAGLEKVSQRKNAEDWIKSKIPKKDYSYTDAVIDTLSLATPFISMALLYWIFSRSNPENLMSKFTHSKKSMKVESMKNIKVRFKDVAGMEEAKKQITEFVDFLKKSQRYSEIGARIPKGALLTGPPGTGKTMLAKACAGEAGTSFFYVSGSEFVEMFVGLGASRVRQLFSKARLQAPSIIFIDQIDAIGKKRQTSRNEEKDSTLNQLLVEMDGFSSHETVIVLAATNRKDTLDNALTRPGRFDRMVEVSLPQIKAREEIFMVHLAPLKINPNKPLAEIAQRLSQLTPGFSGADIANLCNEAAIIATRKKRSYIEDEDFEEASERIMAGYVKTGLSNVKSKKRVAYHEAGHAVCGWFLRGGDPLVKLTIIPRSKGALGYAQYLPKSAYIRTKDELIDQVSIMLGGTTSEQVFLGDMSSGNSDDLQKVYSLTRRMVAQFGMGESTYNVTLDEQQYVRKESEKLANAVDEEILGIVDQASKRARKIIEEKRDIIEALAEELLKKQTINSEDIVRIMGERPRFEDPANVEEKPLESVSS